MDPMIPKEFRDKFAKGDAEELTRSPQVNELVKLCKGLEEGKGDIEAITAQVDVLYDVQEAMSAAYEVLAPTQPRTELFKEMREKLPPALDELKEGLDEMSLYLEDEDIEHVHIGLDTVKKSMDEILICCDALKKEEEDVEIFSYSPPVNELIRIGKGVISGDFEPPYFYRRYLVVEDIYKNTFENMTKLSKQEPDTKAMEEQVPVIMKALELFREGLDDLKEYFEYLEEKLSAEEPPEESEEETEDDFDVEEIVGGGIDKVQEASKAIYDANVIIKEGIDQAMEEDAKKKEWQSKMPPGLAKQPVGGGLDIKVGAPAPGVPAEQEQLMIPPNYKKVYDAGWAVSKKEISKEEFSKTLDWLEDVVKKNMADLPKLQKPKKITKEEDELFEETKNSLTRAMENSIKGLDEMRKFNDDDDISHLENGLDVVMRCGDALYKIQLAGQEAEKKMKKTKAEAAKKKK